MSDWQNEVTAFHASEGDYNTWDLVVEFRDGHCADLGSLTPEEERVVSNTLAVLKSPGEQEEMEQLAAALTRKANAHKIAPEGMAFPVGLYSQPVPKEVAHIWHNADGTTAPAPDVQHG